jgi:AraC-like DNA-binding protein
MTAGVNSLTDRATGRRPAAPQNPPILASFRPMLDAFERVGCDRAAILRAAGLSERDFDDPDAILSDAACAAFFCEALSQRPVPNFGLRVAERIPIGAYPLLDYLILTSDTVGEGFHRLAKYLRLVGSPCELSFHDRKDAVVVRLAPTIPFNAEFTLALAVLDFRQEADGEFRAASLQLRHRPDDPKEFERILGCPVRAEAEADELAIPRSVWALPLRRRDSRLHAVLASQAEERMARLGSDDRAAAQLRRVLSAAPPGVIAGLSGAARRLGTSPRTLQRRLAAEGTSFQEVLDGGRRETAESALASSGLSCAEIGYLLGFSEPAAFHRAFKRWTGRTPLAFRREPRTGRAPRRPRAPRRSRRPRA